MIAGQGFSHHGPSGGSSGGRRSMTGWVATGATTRCVGGAVGSRGWVGWVGGAGGLGGSWLLTAGHKYPVHLGRNRRDKTRGRHSQAKNGASAKVGLS